VVATHWERWRDRRRRPQAATQVEPEPVSAPLR
jgi:hypothetical protein